MVIVFWWLIPLAIIAITAAAWLYFRRPHKAKSHKAKAIAHSSRVTKLSTYAVLYKRYQRLLLGIISLTAIAAVLSLVLVTRPVSQDFVSPQQKNRDIMLCLDVSGSMISVDKEVFGTFIALVDNFSGQRIGLTVFNASAASVFPLTDDYELIKSYLKRGESAFEASETAVAGIPAYDTQGYKDYTFITGGTMTDSEGGASLIGNGFASCVNRMGANEEKRSQSIILATDNEVGGTEIITTPEAAAYAKSKDIRVYAIDPGKSELSYSSADEEHKELEQAVLATGGAYYLSQNVEVQTIINEISKQEAALFTAPPEIVRTDIPTPFIIVLTLLVVALFVTVWRYRL